jgi:uncharacterized protein (TIRG00374 family)
MEKESKRQRLQVWVGIACSILCLLAIFLLINPREIWSALISARLDYLLLSALGILGFLFIRAIRWRFMLKNSIPYADVFHVQNIGYMLTFILPLRLGDLARAVLIGNIPPVTFPQGLSTMLVERVLDLLFIVTLLPFTLSAVPFIPPELQRAVQVTGVLGLVAIGILVVAANQRKLALRITEIIARRISFLNVENWVKRIDELLSGLNSLTSLKDGAYLIFLSILVWIPIIFAYYMGMRSVHLEPTWVSAGFVVCAAAFSVAAPSSPGQVGIFHAGVILALSTILGEPEEAAAGFAFLYHGLNMVTVIVLGLIGVWRTGNAFANIIQSTRAMMNRNKTVEF